MKRTSSRRTFLQLGAVCGAVGTAGCTDTVGRIIGDDDATGTDWPMSQYDAGNTGHTPDSGPSDGVSVRWQFETEGAPLRSTWPPAVVDGTVYVGGEWLYALDARTGEKRWQKPLGRAAAPAVSDGIVVVHRDAPREEFVGLDASTGEVQWRVDIGGTVYSWPTVADGTVYTGGTEGETHHVHAIDIETGTEEWRVEVDRIGPPAVVDGTVYVGDQHRNPDGTGEPTFHALDAETGEELWRTDLAYVRSPVVADGRVFATSGATIYALDAGTGSVEWTVGRELDRGAVLFPAVADDTLYVSGTDVSAHDMEDGSEKWQVDRGMHGLHPTVTDDTLYATDGDGRLHALSTDDGEERWSLDIATPEPDVEGEQRGGPPAISGGTAYVLGVSGTVYALEEV